MHIRLYTTSSGEKFKINYTDFNPEEIINKIKPGTILSDDNNPN
jgi:hypothetical protein